MQFKPADSAFVSRSRGKSYEDTRCATQPVRSHLNSHAKIFHVLRIFNELKGPPLSTQWRTYSHCYMYTHYRESRSDERLAHREKSGSLAHTPIMRTYWCYENLAFSVAQASQIDTYEDRSDFH